nr:pentatricopeptide repeat-containing protein At4g22760 [Ipomoea batatas]GME02402.1 pentatricopeptide repeat-containing protein At4g22760 [Ipomoea batatas]
MADSSEGEEEGKLTGGSQQLLVDDDLCEMAKKAAWSVSSCKAGNGITSLRDDNLDTYWQSDGAQPHLVNIQFQKKVKLQLVVLYVDFKLDESYTPSKISIRACDGFHNLKEIKSVELVKPSGWVYISLSGNDPRETFVNTFMLQVAILSNHLNGRDTHIRQIKVYGPRPNPIPLQPFQFTSTEFITHSIVRLAICLDEKEEQALAINQAKQIHGIILVSGLHDLEPLLVRRVLMSAGSYNRNTIQYVKLMLRYMQTLDIFSVASTIRFLTEHSQFREAISVYVQLQRSGLSPSTFAISSAIKACSRILDKIGGTSLHGQSYKYGFCRVVYVQTALVDFYAKMGKMESARSIFDEMVGKNVVSWNSMLAGYVKSGDLVMAQSVFDLIPEKDVVSWNSMVSGYARAGNMEQAYALFQKMPERSSASWNAMISGYIDCGKIDLARSFFDAMDQKNHISLMTMISGYSKCGDVESARKLFGQMAEKEHRVYNAMISTYAQNSRPKEALQLFREMLQLNVQPDYMTLASAISACSQLGDLKFGSWIESYMKEVGIQMDDHLATAFIDLYAKCGSTEKAYGLFHGLEKKDVVAYTAMILGCGINGRANDAIELFDEMVNFEIDPNSATLTAVLTAYSHVGLVEKGYQCFVSMQKYGLSPNVDHYAIAVDLLSRAGRLEEAYDLIKSMPMQPHAGVWGALLLGCSLQNNLEIGEVAARHCFDLEPDSTGYRSLLANIYASAGRWDDAEKLRMSVEANGYTKLPGSSWT